MKAQDRMTIDERRKYLRIKQKRYLKATRTERATMLDEMVEVTGLHRKSIIRLLKGDLARQPRRNQRGRTYGVEVHYALKVIAESCDFVCAERLQPNLVWLAQHLAHHGELEVTSDLLTKLGRISVSTVKRILRRLRQDEPQLHRRRPSPKGLLRQVPMRRISWDEPNPGHFEVDLVHHCGNSAGGHYVHSLQMVDVATGWSERVATLGRSYRVMRDGFQRILSRTPLPVLEIHSDNGSEFLQHHMIRFWQEEVGGVELSRGRPYRKNDQRFVEQKNATLIRKYLGHWRLDTVAHTNLLNQLYQLMGIYYNFFQPVLRVIEKSVETRADGSTRTRRRYDQARTPLDRLCRTGALSADEIHRLQSLRNQMNPRQLRREIYAMLDKLLSLPGAKPEKTEDIYETLRPAGYSKPELLICGFLCPSGYSSPRAPTCPHINSSYDWTKQERKERYSFHEQGGPVTLSNGPTTGLGNIIK
jgi:hypothetical protein